MATLRSARASQRPLAARRPNPARRRSRASSPSLVCSDPCLAVAASGERRTAGRRYVGRRDFEFAATSAAARHSPLPVVRLFSPRAVVYMSEFTMPSTTIKSQLERDGYAVLEDFLRPAECEELVAAGLELTEDAQSCPEKFIFSTIEENKQQLTESYFLESGDKMRFFFEPRAVGPDGTLLVDRKVSLNKAGHALHLLHPIFRCYTFCDRVKAVCRQLGLKEPAVVQSMYIYKNPGVGGEVVAHQDSTYLYAEPVPPVGFWIALEDATVRNGCLYVARGSHASGVHRRLVRNPVAGGRPALIYDRGPSVYPHSAFTAVPVARGTLVLLHGHVVHRSAHNKSPASRHAYTFHVIEKQDNTYAANNWLQEGPAAPFLNLYDTPQTE